MHIRTVAAAGYRSLRSIHFPVGPLTVFIGANGVGKTNLYRALQLLQSAAAGTLARELASEGGMQSALWTGKRTVNKPARIKLSVGFAAAGQPVRDDYSDEVSTGVVHSYGVEVGIRVPTAAAFPLEPQVKEERLTFHNGARVLTLLERRGPAAFAREEDGKKQSIGAGLLASETALGALQDPARFPEVDILRRTPCSPGGFIMSCAPTAPRRCANRVSPSPRRRSPPTVRIWRPSLPRWCISARTRSISTASSTTPFRERSLSFPSPTATHPLA